MFHQPAEKIYVNETSYVVEVTRSSEPRRS